MLKRQLFAEPVIIERIELLRDRSNCICRVRSKDGAERVKEAIRSMQVARMAEAAGLQITPHISGGGLGYVYMLQMVSVCPVAAEYHEFKMFHTRDANGTVVPVESRAEPFESIDGIMKVPMGPGLGVRIDADYIQTHQVVKA